MYKGKKLVVKVGIEWTRRDVLKELRRKLSGPDFQDVAVTVVNYWINRQGFRKALAVYGIVLKKG